MRLAFDVETDGWLHTMTKIHCIEAEDVDTGEIYSFGPKEIKKGLKLLAQADTLIGHNILMFDLYAILNVDPKWTPKDGVSYYDTMIGSQVIWPDMAKADKTNIKKAKKADPNYFFPTACIGKHKLKAWGYRLGLLKGTYGEEEGAFEVWTPEMQAYCQQDVSLTVRLYKMQMAKQYPELPLQREHEFASVIAKQSIHGFCFNTKSAQELVCELSAERKKLKDELQAVFPVRFVSNGTFTPQRTGYQRTKYGTKLLYGEGATFTRLVSQEFNPNSDQQIVDRLIKDFGWKPIEFTDSGNPSVTHEILEELPWPAIKPLARYKMIQKRLSQIADGEYGWIRREINGRIHGSMLTNGTVTGRCSHYAPNMAQIPAVHNPYGTECRSLFLADTGFVMVGVDADGLELRMLGHFLSKYDDGAFLRAVLEGSKKDRTDVHSRNLAALMKAGPWFDNMPFDEARDVAKRFMYALIYGGGNKKLGLIVGGTAKDGAALRAAFMAGIKGFQALCAAIEQRIEETGGWISGLDGRRLTARSAHSALNLLLQSAGALIVKEATVIAHNRLNERWPWAGGVKEIYSPLYWAQVNHIHDEIQYVARPEIAEEVGAIVVDSLRLAGERFDMRVPIEGTCKIGANWADTH